MKPSTKEKLSELLEFAKKHNLAEILWETSGTKIAFRRGNEPLAGEDGVEPFEASADDSEAEPINNESIITSPIVGKFRRAVTKDGPPVVMVGNHVKPGDRLAVVTCMRIPNDVVSYCSGEVKKILIEDGKAVEYGQPLFVIEPTDSGESEN